MPKIKPKKTLTKRIRITRNGKLMRKQSRMGHLKIKMDSSRKSRKSKQISEMSRGHEKKLKRLLRI